jgi:hypothetical protein
METQIILENQNTVTNKDVKIISKISLAKFYTIKLNRIIQ